MGELFSSTLNQMAVLFSLIIIGYLLVKLGCVSEHAAATLSKLENVVLVPAAYGEDTTSTAEMVLVSHVMSVITIPFIFMLFQAVVL